MNIDINIERIVLSDVDPQMQRSELEQTLTAQIRHAMADSDQVTSREIGNIDAGQVDLGDQTQLAQHVADQIAKGVQS